jgi:ketosteroid isomerase-like protein
MVFTNCTTTDKEADKAEAITAIDGFYEAMTAFDYEAVKTYCTDDFSVIDDGKMYSNLDEFLEMAKSYEGATIEFDIKVQKAVLDVNSAFMIVKFNANITFNDNTQEVEAIENYSLAKEDGKWLIRFIHSTYLTEMNPITYKSVHLLKVTEELSVSILDEPLKEINSVIHDLGHPECGYVIYKVQTESETEYTHVFEGKWLSEENYKTIHEHPKYKELIEKHEAKFNDIFVGQVYFKVKQ